MLIRLVRGPYAQFLLVVEKSLACGKEYIVGARIKLSLKRAIALHAKLLVGAVGPHKINHSRRQLVAILLAYS